MDEREVHELLSNTVEGVAPSADLPARAERRYRRRRNRAQALVAAVVIVLIGSSVAGASVLARGDSSRATVSPSVTTVPPTTSGLPLARPPNKTAPVDPTLINSMSFVDANVGFGTMDVSTSGGNIYGSGVIRTGDGGRTWRYVGVLPTAAAFVHFENAADGVAWGSGPLETTTDGGIHWKAAEGGPVDNSLAWSTGRLWALTPCVQSTPCGSRPVLISDDTGVTWQQTAPLQLGFGSATVLATSRSTAYVVEPATDAQPGPWQVAITGDGGASWTYKPVPCAKGTESPSLAFNGRVLLLACIGEPAGDTTMKQEFTSSDNGSTWSPAAFIPGETADLSSVRTTFVANPGRSALVASGDDGQDWFPTPLPSAPTRTDVVPGVGMWASVYYVGVWFSPNGIHWELRAQSPHAPPPTSTTTPATTPATTPGETRP